MKKNNYLLLVLFIVGCEAAGLIGSLFTFSAIPNWYAFLNKPFFSPPNFIFGPVWTTLYLLMGISAYRIYRFGLKKKEIRHAMNLFSIQLLLNTLWSIIFFGMKNPGLAFMEIVLMWVYILFTILKFRKIDPLAAYLLIPYLMWVSFASILNLSIVILN